MRLLILTIITALVAACSQKIEIRNFNMHLFSSDVAFVEQNLMCFNTYKTDPYDTRNNEIFRCSNPDSNVFLELETKGNNSENIKDVTLVWKQWRNGLAHQNTQIDAKKFAAVMAKLYAPDKQIELIDAFFNDVPTTFTNIIYDIETKTETSDHYISRKIKVSFKDHDMY